MIEKRTCNNPKCRDKGRVFSQTRFLSGISPECPTCHKASKPIHSTTIGRSKGGSGKRGGKGLGSVIGQFRESYEEGIADRRNDQQQAIACEGSLARWCHSRCLIRDDLPVAVLLRVRGYGHNNHRENYAYNLEEVKQFMLLFPGGPVAVAIAVNAFLNLRAPEVKRLRPEDYDPATNRMHCWNGKRKEYEWMPVAAPLGKLVEDGHWEPINLRKAERAILKRIKGTNLKWHSWYAFRRGMMTNLYLLGVRPEEACIMLRNTAEVCRKHYLKLQKDGVKKDTMALLEQAYSDCAACVQ